jgi:hypothetical protein
VSPMFRGWHRAVCDSYALDGENFEHPIVLDADVLDDENESVSSQSMSPPAHHLNYFTPHISTSSSLSTVASPSHTADASPSC